MLAKAKLGLAPRLSSSFMFRTSRFNFPLAASLLLLVAPATTLAQKPELVVQTGHSGIVTSVAFSADGKTLASGSTEDNIQLWDVSNGRELRTLRGRDDAPIDSVNSVAFSPDGKTLASGSWYGMIELWDVTSGKELRSLRGHSGSVSSVAFS